MLHVYKQLKKMPVLLRNIYLLNIINQQNILNIVKALLRDVNKGVRHCMTLGVMPLYQKFR